jgi:hypothetical protein
MALNTYSDLRTALTARLDVTTSDISNSNANDLFTEAERRIYRDIRIRDMETSFSIAIASGVAALPSGYCDLKFAYLDTSPVVNLLRKTAQWIYTSYPNRASSGKPKFIAREASNFIFGPYPDSGYTVKGVCYVKPSTVVDDTLKGALLTNSELLLYKACELAELFLERDARAPKWERMYEQVKAQLMVEDEREQGSGPLQITTA